MSSAEFFPGKRYNIFYGVSAISFMVSVNVET